MTSTGTTLPGTIGTYVRVFSVVRVAARAVRYASKMVRSVLDGIEVVLSWRPVGKVRQSVVSVVAVQVPGHHPVRTRANEGQKNQRMNCLGANCRISFTRQSNALVSCGETSATHDARLSSRVTHHATLITDLISSLVPWNGSPRLFHGTDRITKGRWDGAS